VKQRQFKVEQIVGVLKQAEAGVLARETVDLRLGLEQLIQGRKNTQADITKDKAVEKTLIELSFDSVNKLSGSMGAV